MRGIPDIGITVGPDETIYAGSSDHKLHAINPAGEAGAEEEDGGGLKLLAEDGTLSRSTNIVGDAIGVAVADGLNGWKTCHTRP